jgi:signal transduction histidine kinase
MLHPKFISACIAIFAASLVCDGQTTRISELKKSISVANGPDQKLAAILSLCEETESLNIDTLYSYALQAKAIASAQKSIVGEQLAAYYIAYGFYQKSKLDSAIQLVNEYLPVLEKQATHSFAYTRFALLNGRCLMRKQQYKEGLAQYYKILSEAENKKDTLVQMMSMSGIGWVYDRMEDTRQALNWFLKGIDLGKNTPYINKTVFLYPNTGIIYNMLDKNDSALLFLRKGIEVSRQTESLTDLANSLAIYAGIMMDLNRMPEAQKPLLEALEVRKKIGDPNDIITDMGTLSMYYFNASQPQKGIDLALKAIQMANQYHLHNKLSFLYDALAKNYKAVGNLEKYGETLSLLLAIKDSVYRHNSAEAIAELTEKYEVQKKENTIIHQQLDLVKKDYLIYLSIVLFLLAVFLGYAFFRNYKKRQQQKEQLAVSEAEENERKRIAADLHDNLGAYAASIASNVNLLSMSQKDSISAEAFRELQNNSNAIVADLGDTIWALKKEGLHLTAISDRLKVFIQRIQPGYPSILMDVNEEIGTDHVLSPSQGFHLFQTIQEAVNNAVKHSGGDHVVITITGTDRTWAVMVSDNGKGIQPGNETREGNGLLNMRNRAIEAGWIIEWKQKETGGTIVMIRHSTI